MRINTLLLTASLAAGSISAASAQHTGLQFGPQVGLNLATLDGQINRSASFKPGLLLGAFVRWRPSERIAIQPELVYSQQGTANKATYLGHEAVSKIRLNYLNIPLLVKVYLGNVVNLQVGPQVGFLLSGRREGQYGYYTSSGGEGYLTEDVSVSDSYKADFALCGGLGIDLPNGLLASVRIKYGMTNIDGDTKSMAVRQFLGLDGLHNRAIEFSVGYAIGGKK